MFVLSPGTQADRITASSNPGAVFAAALHEDEQLDDDAVAYATSARGERRRPVTGWVSLTPTQAEVATLAGDVLTNREVADRVLMGTETVKTHLSRLYANLGVRNRDELAHVIARTLA